MKAREKTVTAVVLAAGKGTRMNSPEPKVLHEILGRPMIYYVLNELFKLNRYVKQIVVILGYKGGQVERKIKKCLEEKKISASDKAKIKFVYQSSLLGTADALKTAAKHLKHKNVLVVCGDTPLITSKTLSSFISFSFSKRLSCCLLSANIERKNSLGVILRDAKGRITAIREKIVSRQGSQSQVGEKSYSEEVNSGIYCFDKIALLSNLPKIKKNKNKGEYFLTDIVEIFYKTGFKTGSCFPENSNEILGINTWGDLCLAEGLMRERVLERFIEGGVRIIDPKTTFIDEDVLIGKNTVIYPFTFIEKGVIIASNCSLGPFIRIREKTSIGEGTQAGNFIEINRTITGKDVKIKHFGYLGDAELGDNVNIGAGTVIANYDGKLKHKTSIEKGAFIGSDTVLVAPVKVGRGGVTGAGSVVVKDVGPGTVVVGVPAKKLNKKG